MKDYVFGLDIGGMSVKIGLFKGEELIEKFNIKTNTDNKGENILPSTVAKIRCIMAEKGIDKDSVKGIGIGVPGAIIHRGVAKQAVNINWENVDVKGYVEGELGLLTLVANDANVAALGEMWKGDFHGDNVALFTLGTGVGGGIIVNGKIVEGTAGSGGEVGHFPIVDEDLPWTCGCGNKRCVEQLCAAPGLVKQAEIALVEDDQDSSLRLMDKIEAKDVLDQAKNGDKIALKVVDQYTYYLGKTLAIVASITNPSVFIIGGGVSNAGRFLLDKIEDNYKKLAFIGASNADVVQAKLGNDAGIYGAAKMIIDEK